MRRLIVTSVLVVIALLSSSAYAQQVVSTFSTGAPGDPFKTPTRLAFDGAGNLFVSDTGNHRVQRIDKQTGAVTTVAGTGLAGYSGDGAAATLAQLDCPMGLAFDSAGNLYIADECQNVVRKVTNGVITSFAGNGATDACASIDGAAANQTPIDAPIDVAVDRNGSVYILSLGCADVIRRVDAASGLVSTPNYMLGSRGSISIVFDNAGNLLIMRFYQVALCGPASGGVLTGNESCDIALSGFTDPYPMAFDKAGNLFFLEDPCDGGCLLPFKATPGPDGTLQSGSSAPYAGNGTSGYSGDGGPPLDASFRNPRGLALDANGNLFIADTGNNVIRMVSSGPTAPSLSGLPANPSNQSSATFSFEDDSSVATFECTLDGVTSPCASPATYQNLHDGSHTFSLIGRASSGAPSNAASYTWTIDTVPPPVPSIDSHPANPSTTAFATFTLSESEAGASLTCTLDGSAAFCASPVVYSGLADGSHAFSVQASDAAGNHSAANTFNWTIHTVAPPAPHLDSAPPALTNSKISSFSFSDTQAGVSFLCQLDGQGSTACISPITFVGLSEGGHRFAVVANDATAGRSSAAATYNWTIDTTPPNVDVTAAVGIVTIPAPSKVAFSSGSADVVSYQCSLDGGAFSPCSSPFNQSVPSQGTHTLAVRAIDAAGNVGESSTSWSVTYCRCTLAGGYTDPVLDTNYFIAASADGQFTVSSSGDAQQQLLSGSVIRTSDGSTVYSFSEPLRNATAWQFSPDSTRFLYHSLDPNSQQDTIIVLDLTGGSARKMLTTTITSGTAALFFSPSGAYFVAIDAAISFTTIRAWRVAGVSNAVLVHSSQVAGFGLGSIASWGFNQQGSMQTESAFLIAWLTGQNTFSWTVANLTNGTSFSQSSTAQSAYWQFNPCGDIVAFVNQSSPNEEQVDLFDVDGGAHLGETSFPLQTVTLSSQPTSRDSTVFQEVATISNPQQTIVIATDPTCNPNTPSGSSRLVAPVAPQTNTSPVTVTFSTVTQTGGTGVSSASTGNAPPAGFGIGNPPVYFDVSTSASYTGTIVLCFSYAGITFNGAPHLFHYVNGAWVDVTVSVDTVHQTICGNVTSLSPFAIFSAPSASADTTPPAVNAPASITIPATEAGGARGNASAPLAAFLTGATATDLVDASPTQLPPQVAGVNVDTGTLFPCGTTQVTFRFRDASGNIGTATATVTVVVGNPKISGQIVGRGTLPGGSTFLDVKLANTGTGNARKLALDLVLGVPLKGAGLIKTVSPTKPVVIGNLDVGATQTVRVVLAVPASVKQFLLTAGGTMVNVQGRLDLFAVTQVVNP